MDLYHLYNKALVIKQDEDQETKRINLSLFDTLSISSSIPWIYANLFRVCSDIHDLSLIEEDLSIIDWMIGSSSLFNYQSNASNQQWNSHCSQELNASIQQYILYNTNYRNNQYLSSLFYEIVVIIFLVDPLSFLPILIRTHPLMIPNNVYKNSINLSCPMKTLFIFVSPLFSSYVVVYSFSLNELNTDLLPFYFPSNQYAPLPITIRM